VRKLNLAIVLSATFALGYSLPSLPSEEASFKPAVNDQSKAASRVFIRSNGQIFGVIKVKAIEHNKFRVLTPLCSKPAFKKRQYFKVSCFGHARFRSKFYKLTMRSHYRLSKVFIQDR